MGTKKDSCVELALAELEATDERQANNLWHHFLPMAIAILRTMFKLPFPRNLRRKRKVATNKPARFSKVVFIKGEKLQSSGCESTIGNKVCIRIPVRLRVSGRQTFPFLNHLH